MYLFILLRMEQFPLLKPRDSIDIITEQISDYWIQLHHNYSHQDLSPLFSDIMLNCRNYVNLTIMEETFCLLFYVRDISHGLGLRQVFYMMMMHLYDSFPMLALSVFPILLQYYDPLPYGSWRDITGLCDYLKHHSQQGEEHPLIMSVLEYLNHQLKHERYFFSHNGICDTNMVKWIPRENSRNGWVFSLLAHHWTTTTGARERTYRKLVSKLRCSISITERHMCREHIHPKLISIGTPFGGKKNIGHFIRQKNYTNQFDAMCSLLFHPRYQFVRRKFRIIVQAPPEATPSFPTSVSEVYLPHECSVK